MKYGTLAWISTTKASPNFDFFRVYLSEDFGQLSLLTQFGSHEQLAAMYNPCPGSTVGGGGGGDASSPTPVALPRLSPVAGAAVALVATVMLLAPASAPPPPQYPFARFGLPSLIVPAPCQADVLYEQLNYICVRNEIQCLLGWKNPENYCRDPICPVGCDAKHGVCVKPNVCHCRAGYYGHGCKNCVPLPGCVHGGCDDAYDCNCFPGWKGIFCSEAICKAGCNGTTGFCDRPGECNCHIGWQGENCTECSVLPGCLNGACSRPLECNCLDGWKGEFCDVPKCKDGCHEFYGTCSEPGECTCVNGYQGELCDECRPYPGCLHGTCSEPWTCNCEAGWKGIRCDVPVSDHGSAGGAGSQRAGSNSGLSTRNSHFPFASWFK